MDLILKTDRAELWKLADGRFALIHLHDDAETVRAVDFYPSYALALDAIP